jgi:hypothetical protein
MSSREVKALRGLDRRHQKLPAPVVLRQVDREPKVDIVMPDDAGLAVDFGVGRIHLR